MAGKNKNSNATVIIVAVIIVIVLAAAALLSNLLNRIPDNDPSLVGNTGGNLNNYGYFCEDDDTVYFANSYDGGSIYSMTPDQGEIKKLYNCCAKYINAGGKYLYFNMESSGGGTGLGYIMKTTGIYRAAKNGSKMKALSTDPALIMVLSGNDLYYQATTGFGVGLKKLDIHGNGKTKAETVESTYVINPACVENGTIYYGGTENDHYLYSMNTTNGSIQTVWGGNVWNPVYDSGYFYYMDISNDYCLCRYNTQTNTSEILTHDRADTFNVGYGYVYYSVSTSADPGLYRMHTDGSNSQLVINGVVSDINMTSDYTYFHMYDDPQSIYYVSTTGSNAVSEFFAAKNAVVSE